MKIAYYMPFKPMNHANPSGDLITGSELYHHLTARGHNLDLASSLRCRWIYYRPKALLQLWREKNRILRGYRRIRPDLWLSYHSYYKAPDLLGAICSRKLAIPYVIFQGIYSTKRRKQLKTLPGFLLNKKVLQTADHIFTNKRRDLLNLKRLVPDSRLSYIAPGVHPEQFSSCRSWRKVLRQRWAVGDQTIVMTAAMMRPGVKSKGIHRVIESCSELVKKGLPLRLIIAGDGSCKGQLERLAARLLPERVQFVGRIPRGELYQYYSAADIFAFPGIDESLGMVYLEAQACNLPVVAYRDWGGGEAVIHDQTGLLSPAANPALFTAHIEQLLQDKTKRITFGRAAGKHIRRRHDLERNYLELEQKLQAFTPAAR